ncbi:MAG: NUDIX hydrolase [archaeon]|nr:NUDIX hydrolase [archaeon]
MDENDSILEYKEHSLLKPNDIYRVSSLWVSNSKGHLLFAQRALSKKRDPGKWGPAVAGTVEKGETYEENIYKEAEEEIGLRGVLFQKGPKNRIRGNHQYFCQLFLVSLDQDIGEFHPGKEVEALRWFSKKELLDGLKKNPSFFIPNADQWLLPTLLLFKDK